MRTTFAQAQLFADFGLLVVSLEIIVADGCGVVGHSRFPGGTLGGRERRKIGERFGLVDILGAAARERKFCGETPLLVEEVMEVDPETAVEFKNRKRVHAVFGLGLLGKVNLRMRRSRRAEHKKCGREQQDSAGAWHRTDVMLPRCRTGA